MAEIKPFRREKRLKSLDELDGPIWAWDLLPTKPIATAWFIVAGLALGVGIGLVLL